MIDEAWAAVRHGANYFQSSLKLSRAHGVATVLVCHRPSDLTAQSDDGTAVGEDRRRSAVRHPDPSAAAPATRADRRRSRAVRSHRTRTRCGSASWCRAGRSGASGPRSAVVQTILAGSEQRPVRHRPGDGRPMPSRLTADHVGRSTTCSTAPTWPRCSTNSPSPSGRTRARPQVALPDAVPRRPPRVGDDVPRPTAGTNAGAAGPATTAATPSTSSSPSPASDRTDAVDWLANRAGMFPDRPLPPPRPKRRPPRPRRHGRWTRSSPATSTPATASSTLRPARPVRDWLHAARASTTTRSRPT